MRPSRENIFRLLARLEQDCGLPEDGPVSLFIQEKTGDARTHHMQLVIKTSGDTVFVRFTRLPFVRPYAFSRQALRVASL